MSDEDYWDALSPSYDGLYDSPWSLYEDEQLGRQLQGLLSEAPGKSVLDIGCGTGLGYRLLRTRGVFYTGLDISSEMLANFRRRHAEVTLIHGSADDLSDLVAGRRFDLIICINVAASFVSDLRRLLRSVHDILNTGGIAFVSVLNRSSLRRFVRLRSGDREFYRTRGDAQSLEGVWAQCFSRGQLSNLISALDFSQHSCGYRSVLGGVLEQRWAIPIERQLTKILPALGHELFAVCRR